MTDQEFSDRIAAKLKAKLTPSSPGIAAAFDPASLIALLVPLLQDVIASLMDKCRKNPPAEVASRMASPNFATRFAVRREIRAVASTHDIPYEQITATQDASVDALMELGKEATDGERMQIVNAREAIPEYSLI